MMEGTFTWKKLWEYVKNGVLNFTKAHAVINGDDRAEDIGKQAKIYLDMLTGGR